jgi:hypothetical protein
MSNFGFYKDEIFNISLIWFMDIPEQYDLNHRFFLSDLPHYRRIDEIYNHLLQNPSLFANFLSFPGSKNTATLDPNYTREEFLFDYTDFLAFNLAYYLLRYNGFKIYEYPELRKIEELLDFTVNLLWEGKKLQLPNEINSLICSIIQGEKFSFRSETGSFLCQFLVALSDDEVENSKLLHEVSPVIQYQINRINYRKTHNPKNFTADDFFKNYLPFGLFEVADRDFDDITLFDNLITHIENKLTTDPGTVMKTFLYINRLSSENSFLARIAKSTDIQIIENQIAILNGFYNRIFKFPCPHLIELYKFIEMYFILKESGRRYLERYPEHLAETTATCTRFLNSMRSIHKEKLADDEQSFRYELCSLTAWFLSEVHFRWKGVKLLLAIFRSSKIAWLNPDLSCKSEDFGYKNLAYSIIRFFESKNVDVMKQLRWNIAEGLAGYLKPIPLKRQNPNRIDDYEDNEKKLDGFDASLFEPNPYIRYAYVRAIGNLKMDTNGNGRYLHSILENVKENDPSEMVREAASMALKELTRYQSENPEENNNRLLIEAFWWIRYAHMKTLNMPVDEKTANEYRIFEAQQYK